MYVTRFYPTNQWNHCFNRIIWTRSATNFWWRPIASAIKHSRAAHRAVSTADLNSLLPQYRPVITARMEAGQFREITGDCINTTPPAAAAAASSKVISYRRRVRRQPARLRLPVDICRIRSTVRRRWLPNRVSTPTTWWTTIATRLRSSLADQQASQSRSFLVSALLIRMPIIMMPHGCCCFLSNKHIFIIPC